MEYGIKKIKAFDIYIVVWMDERAYMFGQKCMRGDRDIIYCYGEE